MAVTNLLKKQVDQPVFEWMRFAPTATSSLSALATSDDLGARYIYYIVGQALWRYDTYSDGWQELAPPPQAPLTAIALKYSKYSGYRGDVLSATTNTVTLAGFRVNGFNGQTIRIIAGKGAGQERTITSTADSVIADFGIPTTASASLIQDSTKKWKINQWLNYQCRLLYSTGNSQIRKVLYNDTATLYFTDANLQPIDSFNNTGFSTVAPFAAPIATAGSQTNYTIESSTLTVNASWDVTPDSTSRYMIMGGGLWLFSSASSAPWCTWQFYDILSDTWQTKTTIGGQVTAAFGTDYSLDRTGEVGGAFVSNQATTSATSRTLVNSGASMTTDRYANYQLRIISGTGIGQRRRIVGHNATTFWIDDDWNVTPDNTSVYSIYGDTDKIWLLGNGSSTIWQYSVEGDIWSSGATYDYGIARNISVTPYVSASYGPQCEGLAVTSIVRVTTGILTVAVNAGGSNYVVGDLVTCSTGGTLGQAFVTAVNDTGSVTALELAASGSGYTAGSTATTGGSGTSLTITITVGTTALVTLPTSHIFRTGDVVTFAGCATDTSFNANFTILGTNSITTFSIAAPSSSASPTAANSQSTTVLVDGGKNWIVNEHVGKIIHIQTAGISPTTQSRRITSNTANTITIPAITAATNGTSRYVIQDINGFGTLHINRLSNRARYGWPTSGTATTLVDTTKSWLNNQWINCKVRIISGTGVGNEAVITGNTSTTLTVAAWPNATPDTTSKYEILDSFGVVTTGGSSVTTVTDANKNFTTNILAGKRLRFIAGTAIGNEIAISSNTATVITLASAVTTDTTSVYEIYEIPARSAGISCTWLFGLSDTTKKGNQILSFRGGGSNIFDIYNININRWDITPFYSPITTTFTTGSMFTYDGVDAIYATKDATGRIYKLDLSTYLADACAVTPYAQGAAVLGNRMEIIQTTDGLKYLYVMRHTGQEMWRTLVFW